MHFLKIFSFNFQPQMVNLKIIIQRSNQGMFAILLIICILLFVFILFDSYKKILLPVRQVRVGSELAREFSVKSDAIASTSNVGLTTSGFLLTQTSTQYLSVTTQSISRPTTRKLSRCEEIRRRVSWGVVDYANWDGDPELLELVQPIFKKKRLVVWSVDHHPGPISDVRSIIEPLGVEFIEHTLYFGHRACERFCTCGHFAGMTQFDARWILHPGNHLYDHIYRDPVAAPDIARADAFVVMYTTPLLELYQRYKNHSVILVSPARYELTYRNDFNRWRNLNNIINTLSAERRHVISANNLYDVEYMHYFLGTRPDYVPCFSGYTGSHYNPIRKEFAYARHRSFVHGWDETFKRQYRRINATFSMNDLEFIIYDYSDLSQFLGIIHYPYQVHV